MIMRINSKLSHWLNYSVSPTLDEDEVHPEGAAVRRGGVGTHGARRHIGNVGEGALEKGVVEAGVPHDRG
jgi:hypothetical protein